MATGIGLNNFRKVFRFSSDIGTFDRPPNGILYNRPAKFLGSCNRDTGRGSQATFLRPASK